jgi:hypothetical protein
MANGYVWPGYQEHLTASFRAELVDQYFDKTLPALRLPPNGNGREYSAMVAREAGGGLYKLSVNRGALYDQDGSRVHESCARAQERLVTAQFNSAGELRALAALLQAVAARIEVADLGRLGDVEISVGDSLPLEQDPELAGADLQCAGESVE